MTKIFDIFFRFIRSHKYTLAMLALFVILAMADYAFAEDKCTNLSDDAQYLCYCGSEAIQKKYDEGGCWSCDIIFTLMKSMTEVAGFIFDPSSELAKLILGGGACIWIAAYFLKALGSFATQDPAKVIDGLLTFCFKVLLMYVLIDSGIDSIVNYIVNPLLSIGFDIGETFAGATGIGGW